ncbi:MAG: Sapep family Mn(2+)-dependent dipeptidase [Bacilli bacterium]|nr:Sapep family Mn(2+)-dependent dipeptidase [Bacilli bacterium]
METRVALQDFVRIDSVYDETTKSDTMPFGQGVHNALQYIGRLAERFGFDVDYCDGYCTEISYGSGDTLVGIFAHADVVPVTGDWKYEKFGGQIEGNRIYGRGTSDDKGPLMAAFYAMKALKDHNKLEGYRVRLVVGGDEERGSSCLEHYFNVLKKEYPTYGFTPDAEFPLIYGEKGITNLHLNVPFTIPQVKSIKGGVVLNAVCDECVIEIENDMAFVDFAKANKYIACDIEDDGTLMKLTFRGKTAHGSTPEKGVNAGYMGLRAIAEFYKDENLLNLVTKLSDTTGKAFNAFAQGRHLGKTTYNLGVLSLDNGTLKLGVNFRFPEDVSVDATMMRIKETFGCEVSHDEISAPLLLNPQSKLIKTLMKAYYVETGDKTPAFTIGGGTYAKHAKNTVAFGAAFPYSVDTMHQPDEYMNLDDLYLASVIYARAIDKLGRLK